MWAATVPHDQIRNAANKGLALIQASQKSWYSKQSCFSCHQQSLPAQAIRTARQHGITVNEALAQADFKKTFAIFGDVDRAVQFSHVIDPSMSEAYLLLGAEAAGVRPSTVTATYARLIAARQKPDGHWETLDVRPPQSYSTVTATALSIRVLQLYTHSSLAAETKMTVERARTWLAERSTTVTEERSMQLFGLVWAGAARAIVDPLVTSLKNAQQPDGGWCSRDGLSSDAYSTGEALAALIEAGNVRVSDAAVQGGIEYLIRTQAADGSWHVHSRVRPPAPVSPPYFESGYPYGHDQFISAMGASWAVRALADALPIAQRNPVPAPDVAGEAIEAWAEMALFGSEPDLKTELDKGLDPNSSTKNGTTLLMMVQPDLAKTRLLITRGADVNRRSKTRYSALMIAAAYPGSDSTVQYLLEHGAAVNLPRGAGAPWFNASPILMASFAGNTRIIARLRQAGDDPDRQMMLLGSFPVTPLLNAVNFRDPQLARAVLDAGAKVDRPDDDGITPLGWAAIDADLPVARVLIERGANVNHVDKKGMTPVLYAASVDFGDASVLDLLLKSGANPKARTPDGLTAAQLAKKYGHAHLLKSLGEPGF